MVSFWEVTDRAINTGRLKKVKDFDFSLFHTASRLVKEYGIKYDSKIPTKEVIERETSGK